MDDYLGAIKLFPYDFAPADWAYCQGQTLTIQQNNALFSLIGARFGGNGTSNFCLPNLSNASPITGMAYCICLAGLYPMRQ